MISELLAITFVLSPQIREPGAPPKLRVTIENISDQKLEVMHFESDACFAHFFLSLPLTLPDKTKAEATGCPIRSWPGGSSTLEKGASETRELDLTIIFPAVNWTRGKYTLPVEWNPTRLVPYFAGKFAWRASQSSLNTDHFTLTPVLAKLRIEKGQELALSDGGRLSFVAHGHKRTMVGGPSSPLIIHGAFAAKGEKALTPFEVHVHTDETRIFSLPGGFTFELVDHDYDGWMKLKYFGRLSGP